MRSSAIDTSILSLVASADFMGKMVFLSLLIASIWSWAIIIQKYFLFKKTNRQIKEFEDVFWKSSDIEQIAKLPAQYQGYLFSPLLSAVMKEYQENKKKDTNCEVIKDRLQAISALVIEQRIAKLEQGLNFLATVGSSAVFVGLFGTVWGIMHSFQSIAYAKNATLAVVAPGIAEALLATAIGLFAAIPANVFYNYFTSCIDSVDNSMRAFAQNLYLIISKTMDHKK